MKENLLKHLFRRYRTWRFYREMRKRYPDPFIVCSWARSCAHVDGMVCSPHTCELPAHWAAQAAKKNNETLNRICRNLSDDQVSDLVAHRGGCQCCIAPPCPAHSEPLTIAEAKHLGWWPEQAARAEKGAGK